VPFRDAFDCLWCGRRHAVRSAGDLEGWASLCPDCLGRAQENGFLAARLRSALAERAAAARGEHGRGTKQAPPVASPAPAPAGQASGAGPRGASAGRGGSSAGRGEAGADPLADLAEGPLGRSIDDWYLRRGRFAMGPLRDLPWQMELDEVVGWVDALPVEGVVAELAAGTGFWSPLLARKGELWAYEEDEAALDAARRRLMAHGLRAHLHVRSGLAPPERRCDVLFVALLLGEVPDEELVPLLRALRAWLRPGGRLAFVEARVPGGGTLAGPRGELRGRTAAMLAGPLEAASFVEVALRETASAFVMGSGVRVEA
jgi:hypothetical protein